MVLDRSIDGLPGRPLYTCEERAATRLSFSRPSRLQNPINGRRTRRRPRSTLAERTIGGQKPSETCGIEGGPKRETGKARRRLAQARGRRLRDAANKLNRRAITAAFRNIRSGERRKCPIYAIDPRRRALRGGGRLRQHGAEQGQQQRPAGGERGAPDRRRHRPAASRRRFAIDGPMPNHPTLPTRRTVDRFAPVAGLITADEFGTDHCGEASQGTFVRVNQLTSDLRHAENRHRHLLHCCNSSRRRSRRRETVLNPRQLRLRIG